MTTSTITWNKDYQSFVWRDIPKTYGTQPLEIAFVSPPSLRYPITITQIDITGSNPGPCLLYGRPVYAPLATRLIVSLDDNTDMYQENIHLNREFICDNPRCVQWKNESFILDTPIILTDPGQTIYFFFYNNKCPYNLILINEIVFHTDQSYIPDSKALQPAAPSPKHDSDKIGTTTWILIGFIIFLFIIILVLILA